MNNICLVIVRDSNNSVFAVILYFAVFLELIFSMSVDDK